MGRIRKSSGWNIDASSTSAAPVGNAGTIRLRSNAAATGIEASYDGAAYVPFGGSAALKWNALTAPDGDLTLAHGNWKTQFDFTAADASENCFTIQSAADAAGTGAVLYVRSQGTTSTKLPFQVDANGAAAFTIDAGGSGTFSKDLTVTDGETILGRTSDGLNEHPFLAVGTLTGTNTTANLYYNSRFLFIDSHSTPALDSSCALRVTYNRNAPGTWATAAAIVGDMLLSGSAGDTISYWTSFKANCELTAGTTLDAWAGFYCPVIGGTTPDAQYGFIAEAGLKSGFGTITPTATLHVSGTVKFDLGSDAQGDMYFRSSAGAGGIVNKLTLGTSGQVLKVGAFSNPVWATLAADEITTGILALANGGTGAALTDPNADRILFWDDSAGAVTWLTAGAGLTITATTITATGTMTVDGSGSELQARASGTALVALSGSSVSGANLSLGGDLTVNPGRLALAYSTAALTNWSIASTHTLTGSDTQDYLYYANHITFVDQSTAATGLNSRAALRVFYSRASAADDYDESIGVESDALFNFTGTLNTVYQAFRGNCEIQGASGVLYEFCNFYAANPLGLGVVTHTYGVVAEPGLFNGFGTIAPTVPLDVVGSVLVTQASTEKFTITSDAQATDFRVAGFGTTSTPTLSVVYGRGTAASPTKVLATDIIGRWNFLGQYDTTVGHIRVGASIYAQAVADFTATTDARTDLVLSTKAAGAIGTHEVLRLTSEGNLVCGTAVLATGATDGMIHIPYCAGSPTAAGPTTYTGTVPMVYDTSNNQLCIYNPTGTPDWFSVQLSPI